ncbi:hypothetical protein ACQ4PT_056196 [Festuca glaucescens]
MLLLKLDFTRAFDNVSWTFLLSILRQRGFGPRWIMWIALLLSTATTQVLVNGCPGASFRDGQGLRQGGPLSPLLFILVMDVLSGMLHVAEDRGVLSDFQAFGLWHQVCLYADDVVMFAKPIVQEMVAIRCILECF